MERRRIGRYEIRAELGRGGMATVFHAYDPRFERNVAIKVLPESLTNDPHFRARFDREAKTVALLEHPAIVPVYDFGEQRGQPYIVMRLMSGGSLADKLEDGPIGTDAAQSILQRLALALDIAHSKGIIHRDIKPANILFDQYGNAFLSDFGIARLTQSQATLTGSQILGTPAYMSPEQVQGDTQIDGRSDIYSLGVIAFQILTGQMPFQADTPAKVMMKHLMEPAPKIGKFRPDLPPLCNTVIQRALAKNPTERFPSASDFTAALTAAVNHQIVAGAAETTNASADQTLLPENRTSVRPSAEGERDAPDLGVLRGRTSRPRTATIIMLIMLLFLALGTPLALNTLPKARTVPGLLAFMAPATSTPTDPPPSTPTPVPTAGRTQTATDVPVQAVATITPFATVTSTPTPTSTPTSTATATELPTSAPTALVLGGANKIAFLHQNDIWVANLDGSDLIRLTEDGGSKSNLQWTPDGREVIFTAGKCAQSVELERNRLDIIACFEVAEFFEGFAVSPDGKNVAISLNRELYVVPFIREELRQARYRTDLQGMATCQVLNPYQENATKYVRWSNDGQQLAFVFLGAVGGIQQDLIRIISIADCESRPPRVDEFPGDRFLMRGYSNNPVIQNFGWDGEFLVGLNAFLRNDGFGDLYFYNLDTHKASLANPIEGRCCYRDLSWSPDGRYVSFAFQDIEMGSSGRIQIYVIPYGTLGTGSAYAPLSLPESFLNNAREKPQPVLRPAPSEDI